MALDEKKTDSQELGTKLARLRRSGLSKLFSGDYEGALEDLKGAESLDRFNPEVLYNIGITYCKMGLHRSSLDYIKRILDLPFEFIEKQGVKKIYCLNLINCNQLDEALEVIDQVIIDEPRDESALGMKGYILEKKGLINEAIAIYREILTINIDNTNACNSLAFLLAQKNGNLDQALVLAKKVLGISPKNPAYLDTMGFVLMKRGDARAGRFLKKAAEKAPLEAEILDHLKKWESD